MKSTAKRKPSPPTIRVISPGFLPFPVWRRWLAMVILCRIFPLTAMKRHGFMVARSGVGKSELLKLILLRLKTRLFRFPWQTTVHPKRTVILLDPHGELAQQCARQQLFYDDAKRSHRQKKSPNLIYLDPDQTPAINPLAVQKGQDSKASIQRRAQFLTHAFAAMIGHSKQDLSVHMKALLTPMLEVLLTYSALDPKQPSTLFNLADFLDETRNASLIHFAQAKVNNPGLKRFFAGMFQHPRYQASKFSLRSKLMSLLNQEAFVKLLAQPHGSWDLEAALDSGNTLIVNASKSVLGTEVSAIYGRTLLALIKSHVFLRNPKRNCPIYVLLDEAMTFLTEDIQTILEELRKFGLHLILAMQRLPQGEGRRALLAGILTNTGVKIIGAGGYQTLRQMALETGIPKEAFAKLKVGRFLVANQGRRPIFLKIPEMWRNWGQTVSQHLFQSMAVRPMGLSRSKTAHPTRYAIMRPWLS